MEAQGNQETVAAIRKATWTIVASVILSAIAVMLFNFWLQRQEPYWRCKSLYEDQRLIDEEGDIWDALGCDEAPGSRADR